MSTPALFVGLISGTSADAIDAALVAVSDTSIETINTASVAFSPSTKMLLDDALSDPSTLTARQLGVLDSCLGDAFAAAASELLRRANVASNDITAIGSHGQTLFHEPTGKHPFTLQVGDGARIAARTGIDVVNDFRRADVANGGEGAPLAPLLHDRLFRTTTGNRAVLNLGGIANLTLLPVDGPTSGFDTGPANTLMDTWARWCGVGDYDENGALAARGNVDLALLRQLRADAYFDKPAPKSTGREHFNAAWLREHLSAADQQAEALPASRQADVMATLCMLSAATVVDALQREAMHIDDIIVCGGGALNPTLMQMLQTQLSSSTVTSSDDFGIDSEFVEATLFAWLAALHMAGKSVDTRSVTGSNRVAIAGTRHFAPEIA
ncbi:MAG: anhydro-N-acetylmuramic acid kinase [Pseudomonadota bacterium]